MQQWNAKNVSWKTATQEGFKTPFLVLRSCEVFVHVQGPERGL